MPRRWIGITTYRREREGRERITLPTAYVDAVRAVGGVAVGEQVLHGLELRHGLAELHALAGVGAGGACVLLSAAQSRQRVEQLRVGRVAGERGLAGSVARGAMGLRGGCHSGVGQGASTAALRAR